MIEYFRWGPTSYITKYMEEYYVSSVKTLSTDKISNDLVVSMVSRMIKDRERCPPITQEDIKKAILVGKFDV